MSHTIDWNECGSSFYRKSIVYDMKWQNLLLSNVTIAAERYGGHIAIANNFNENGEERSQFNVLFYTSTGHLLNKVQWKNGRLICMEWSVDSERLVTVNDEGRVFQYSLFGQEAEPLRFTLGQEARDTKLTQCSLFDSYAGVGVCALTSMKRFFLVNNVDDPKIWRAPEVPGKSNVKPNCWTVLSRDRTTKVIAVYGNEVYWLEQGGKSCEPMTLTCRTPVKQYVSLALSPDKSKLAFLSEHGVMQITPCDLSSALCECDTGFRGVPRKICWCGNTAVASLHAGVLELISLNGDTLQFPVDKSCYVLDEIDGVRIFDSTSQEFLGKVPDACVETFRVAALEPSATLLEAWKEYDAKSYKAYDYIKMTSDIESAVKTCVEAACHEFDVENQKLLLHAASMGKIFAANSSDSDSFVQAVRTLRVLNAIRHSSIGMPLTYTQYQMLTPHVVIDRLILRGQWPLAVSVARHLRFTPDQGVNKILHCWVQKMIGKKSEPDSEVAERICRKFAEFPGVSYAQAAHRASEMGRKELAALLLENEPNLKMQVTMLMKLNRNEKALSKACDSGDPDLISFVILHLRQSLEKKGDLDLILRKFPLAFDIYKKYCLYENPEHLKALLKQTDDFVQHAICWIKEANNATTFDAKEKIDNLKEAEQCFKQAKDDFYVQQLGDQAKLLRYQAELEEKFGQPFLDLSLRDTVIWLVANNSPINELHQINQLLITLRKEFQISDKQFWWWKIEALGKSDQWTELEKFAAVKKSPIGYLPFVEISMRYNKITEAEKYLPKTTPDEKVNAFIKMNKFEEAANFAFQKRDLNSLNRILSHCGAQNRTVSDKIMQIRQQLITKQK